MLFWRGTPFFILMSSLSRQSFVSCSPRLSVFAFKQSQNAIWMEPCVWVRYCKNPTSRLLLSSPEALIWLIYSHTGTLVRLSTPMEKKQSAQFVLFYWSIGMGMQWLKALIEKGISFCLPLLLFLFCLFFSSADGHAPDFFFPPDNSSIVIVKK